MIWQAVATALAVLLLVTYAALRYRLRLARIANEALVDSNRALQHTLAVEQERRKAAEREALTAAANLSDLNGRFLVQRDVLRFLDKSSNPS